MVLRLLAGLALSIVAVTPALAQTVTVDHAAVGCVVAERFPRLEARFAPGDAVAKAKVLFQPEGARHWYAVGMKSEGTAFSGILPKPKKSLKGYRYYIEVTDRSAGVSRTPEYTTAVADGPVACRDKVMAGALGSASVALEVPAGAPVVPVGFSSSGVAAAGAAAAGAVAGASAGGGGIPAAALIVAGGAAAAGAALVIARGAQGPSPRTYSGPITGQWTVTHVSIGDITVTCTSTRTIGGTVTIVLEESGGTVVGDLNANFTETEIGRTGSCTGDFGGLRGNRQCDITGTVGNLACTERTVFPSEALTVTTTLAFSGSLGGGAISGTMTLTQTGQGVTGTSRNMVSGSTSFPVTLR
jgi:hypothetical protein